MQIFYVCAITYRKCINEGDLRTDVERLSRQPPAERGDVLSEKVFGVILVYSECCNRILWTGLFVKLYFPQFWRLGDLRKSKIKALGNSLSGEDLPPGS